MPASKSGCWITTHWPPLVDRPHVQSVYLQAEHRADCPIKTGDRVVVYEYKTGPTLVIATTGQRVKRAAGREGVVLAAEVISEFRPRPPEVARQEYEERDSMNWAWEAVTRPLAQGRVPRSRVNRILGYAEGHRFFGFNHGKGYKGIDPEQYAELLALLTPIS